MRYLCQNKAVRISVGPFLDATDGVTLETALTVTNCTLTMVLDDDDNTAVNVIANTTLTASGGSNDMVHVANGIYDLELTAAQTNYTGRVLLSITDAANHCPVFHEYQLLPLNVYGSLFAGTGVTADKLAVDVQEWLGNTVYNAGALSLPSVSAAYIEGVDATDQIRDAVVDDATRIDASALNTLSAKAPSKAYLTGSANADGDVQMDEATGNFPGSVASVAGAVGSVTGAVGSVTGAVGSVTGAVASVTAGVTVTTNNDKTGYSLADPDVVADHVLRRTAANVEASANGDAVSYRSLYGAVAKLVNKIEVSGVTLTVYKTDDATSLGTQAVTTDAAADPITALDTV